MRGDKELWQLAVTNLHKHRELEVATLQEQEDARRYRMVKATRGWGLKIGRCRWIIYSRHYIPFRIERVW